MIHLWHLITPFNHHVHGIHVIILFHNILESTLPFNVVAQLFHRYHCGNKHVHLQGIRMAIIISADL